MKNLEFSTRPTLQGKFGMVSSSHWLASQSAMAVLERGGNAFDAAVAAGFVLHVVEPHLNGPAGEVPAIFKTSGATKPVVLCGQGPAPRRATVEHFAELGLEEIPAAGPLAAAVPGAFDAWMLLLRDRGTMTLREVLQFAIEYAREGHPILARACYTISTVRELFEEHWPTSAERWLPGGKLPLAGELVYNHAYADTLERTITEAEAAGANREEQIDAARRVWSSGFVAQAIAAFQAIPFHDSSGKEHAGLITLEDLDEYEASYEEPATYDFRGVTVAKTGAWGQGPVLLQALALLDGLPDDRLDPGSELGLHTIAEAMKLAFADREAWYGDQSETPLDELLEPEYNKLRATLISEDSSLELRPGSPGGRSPRVAAYLSRERGTINTLGGALGEPTVSREGEVRGDTCQVDVVDKWGNMISATPSGGWLQSSPTVPELGFCLGSRLQMFWLEEGLASTLSPGRRPRTTLSPTLVLKDGEAVIACGSPGGDQQDQWQLLFLLRHLVQGMDLQQAIDAPMWHTTSIPGSFVPREVIPGGLVVESRIGEQIIAGLAARGHDVTVSDPWSLGRVCAVARDPDSGILSAGSTPRGMQAYSCGR